MKSMRFLFILISAFMMERAWAQTASVQLVYIYCDYLNSKVPVVEDEEHAWQRLTRHFVKKEVFTNDKKVVESPQFEACIQKNRELFESGEFILEGKSLLEGARAQLKSEVVPPLLDARFSDEERELSTPEYSFKLDEDVERGVNVRDAEADLTRREAQYESMWTDFLNSLRHKVSLSPETIIKVSLK